MPIILYTSKNTASRNIAERLMELAPAIRPLDTKADSVLDILPQADTDCAIILSTHKSRSGKPMLTAHFPGNWSKADMGGKERSLNIANGRMLKSIIRELEAGNRKHKLGWPVFIEADHHGPLAEVPMIFVEIGSTEREWGNEAAARVVADAVNNAVSSRTQNPEPETVKPSGSRDAAHPETAFCIGGGHYAREFTKIELEQEGIAIGHICPKYAIDSLDEDTFRQAIEKSVDPVKRVLVLKESTNAAQKEKIKKLSDKLGAGYWEI